MKKTIFLFLVLLSVANLFAADWVLVSRDGDSELYVNVEGASYKNIWFKEVYKTAKIKQNAKRIYGLSQIPSYDIISVEMTSDYSKIRINNANYYSSQGTIIESFSGEDYSTDFSCPIPDSMGDLYCTIAKKLNDIGVEKFREEMFFENATPRELIEYAIENESDAISVNPIPEDIGIDYPDAIEGFEVDSSEIEGGEELANENGKVTIYVPSICRISTRIASNYLIYDFLVTKDCPYPTDISKRIANFYKTNEDAEIIRALVKDAKMGFKVTVKHGLNGVSQSAVIVNLPQVVKKKK